MRSVILGGGGMLGRALGGEGERRGHATLVLNKEEADVRDPAAVRRALSDFSPAVVFNTAAFTDVDGCEQHRDLAMAVNGDAVAGLGALAGESGARLVQVSTDYVFDGQARSPYREDAAPAPLSAYGESKLLGERHALRAPDALVVRASWLFGPGGRNFVLTVLRLLEQPAALAIVDDQLGSPTYTAFLAAALFDLAERRACGIVHYCNTPPVTWCAFARAIAEERGSTRAVRATTTAALGRPAARPAYSVLDTGRFSRLVGRQVESWREGLREYLSTTGAGGAR